ncbi:hypothetical protein IV498_10090 [Paenarthrobacter sp. Z7-10]|uniref:hypothetical protein n=1 Tax=Paenarthrobacter sp. Z7-10 TaxID=2787635 RepID=UPI0022A9A3CE|nr:hypothetical protein [Paenarthrobacter sp. Z7-10]MCZ2403521.1 hypothetical protein [Paenarthrobacter sp. Z7-10]
MADHNGDNRGDRPRNDRPDDHNRHSERGAGAQRDGNRSAGAERRPFRGSGADRPYGDRPAREGERKPFSGGERKPFGERDRAPRADRPYGDRPAREGERKPFSGAGNRDGAPRSGWAPREERPAPSHNAADLRSSNRSDRERSPIIDDDVTGSELDKVTRAQLRTLEAKNAEWVSKHLVMAGRLMDDDAELAFQHALAASRRGGRLAAVREAVGLTAYAAGHYGEALREFRTYRRISGSNEHLPVMADCERGLGRPDRALDMVRSEDAQTLDTAGKVELAIVASGARADLGQLDAAIAALEIQQLDMNRAFSFSPRLFRAYADALQAAGRGTEAATWLRQAAVAESALGEGEDADPFIVDLADDGEEEPERKKRDTTVYNDDGEAVVQSAAAVPAARRSTAASSAAAVETEVDDAESDYFSSDDADSDEFSIDEENRAELEAVAQHKAHDRAGAEEEKPASDGESVMDQDPVADDDAAHGSASNSRETGLNE